MEACDEKVVLVCGGEIVNGLVYPIHPSIVYYYVSSAQLGGSVKMIEGQLSTIFFSFSWRLIVCSRTPLPPPLTIGHFERPNIITNKLYITYLPFSIPSNAIILFLQIYILAPMHLALNLELMIKLYNYAYHAYCDKKTHKRVMWYVKFFYNTIHKLNHGKFVRMNNIYRAPNIY